MGGAAGRRVERRNAAGHTLLGAGATERLRLWLWLSGDARHNLPAPRTKKATPHLMWGRLFTLLLVLVKGDAFNLVDRSAQLPGLFPVDVAVFEHPVDFRPFGIHH